MSEHRKEDKKQTIAIKPLPQPFKATPIPVVKKKGPEYPVWGDHIIPHLYAAMGSIGPPKSGKTTDLFNIIKETAGPHTQVFIFSSTLNNDDSWDGIRAWLTVNEIHYVARTSIHDNGVNLLKDWMEKIGKLKESEKIKRELQLNPASTFGLPIDTPIGGNFGRRDPYAPPPKKEFLPTIDPFLMKSNGQIYEYAPYIFIFDDISQELRDPQFQIFIKQVRHYRCKIIISSQSFKDNLPGSRLNIRLWHIFGGLDQDTLKNLYRALSLKDIEYETFLRMYRHATKEPYSFLNVNLWEQRMYVSYEREYIKIKT